MNKEQVDLLGEYIKAGKSAVLIEEIPESVIEKGAVVIKDINKIPEEEQRKFIELLKYKKVYIHKLPENCMIFVTYSDLKENPIEEEVYSFMAHI